jgi:hypothetical protein
MTSNNKQTKDPNIDEKNNASSLHKTDIEHRDKQKKDNFLKRKFEKKNKVMHTNKCKRQVTT